MDVIYATMVCFGSSWTVISFYVREPDLVKLTAFSFNVSIFVGGCVGLLT